MNDFLNEFQMLLEKYNVSIVRSASEKGELVVCCEEHTVFGLTLFKEVVFKEEISASDIAFDRYE